MLDIVAADEDELAVAIDGCALHDAEPAFASFQETRPAPSCQHEGLEGPGDEGDHREREQKGGDREKEVAVGVGIIVGMSGSSAAVPDPSEPQRQRLGERPLINR